MCASLLQFSTVGFSLCISSRNLIIPNFSRCVRSLLSETHLYNFLLYYVIAASLAQAPSQFTSMTVTDIGTVDILHCQPNYYQITSGSYQPDNTLTIDYKKEQTLYSVE
jgi:hypothetical protein